MQTFLPIVIPRDPYASFVHSARVLDNKRLGKQRVEALQIYRTLTGVSKGWAHHPAVRMWRGFEVALCAYGRVMCVEWENRGFKDNCFDKFPLPIAPVFPEWMWSSAFSAAHRSNLLRKDPVWYGQWGWKETSDLPYWWPV